MARRRTHSVALKRQVVREYLAGETLHELARRHGLPRNLIRIWVDERLYPTRDGELSETLALDDVAALAQTIHECETRIEAVERLVAKRAVEFEAPGKARRQGQGPGRVSRSSAAIPPDRPPPDTAG